MPRWRRQPWPDHGRGGVDGHAARGAPEATTTAVLQGSGPWTAAAADGTRVTLAAASHPLRPGRVEFTVRVDGREDAGRPYSVDLVSPTMPMHGVVRSSVRGETAEVEIPMEGTWALYVNLDSVGSNTAEFVFVVGPGEAPGHTHSHGGTH